MGQEKEKRNYKKEYETEKSKIKRYTIRVPNYLAKALDEKLQKERKNIFQHSNWSYTKIFKKIIKIFQKSIDTYNDLCYNIITERERHKKMASAGTLNHQQSFNKICYNRIYNSIFNIPNKNRNVKYFVKTQKSKKKGGVIANGTWFFHFTSTCI